ncbi:MAG: TetR/AcrR family transcriptional regulator, partial [Victivallaceae bacterium]
MKKIDESTKDKIMQAALFIFANEGYRNATVRKICELAEVNVAAVNYHFGDKLNLYRTLRRYINENCQKLTLLTEPITLDTSRLELQKWLQKIFSAIRHDENMNVKYALMIYMREQVENPMSNQEKSPIFD